MENEKNKKESIFLGEHGVTSTSANYVANVAKEMIRSEQEALDSLDFVTTTVTDDINQVEGGRISKRGDNEEILMQIPKKLDRVAKMKSLIGWLREGIKAKEELIEKVKKMRDREVVGQGTVPPSHFLIALSLRPLYPPHNANSVLQKKSM